MSAAESGTPEVADAEPASTNGSTNGRHDPWLSWARVVALVAIVSIHVFGHYVLEWGTVSAPEWHVGNLMDASARFGVPLFVIVSGAALLNPARLQVRNETLGSFYRRRAARIGIPLLVWTAFFLCFDRWTTGQPIDVYTFVQGYLWGKPYYHLYFLYVIAGLYLITPFLRPFLANASRRVVWCASLICLALAMLDKAQHLAMGGAGGFNAFSYFVPWIGYYLLGHCLAREFAARRPVLRRHRRTIGYGSAACFVGTVSVTAALTWLLFPRLGSGTLSVTYDYFFPLTLLATVAMAVLVWSVSTPGSDESARDAATTVDGQPEPRRRRPERTLADLTFGIFLLHPIPLELAKQHGPELPFSTPWLGIGYHYGLLLGLVLLCGIVTYLLIRTPVLRRLVS